MSNSALWESLEKTDPTYTKEFSGRGGFSGTAINATWIIKRLTETFGTCGRGWRFVLEEEQIVEGHTLGGGDRAKLHKVLGHLEYYQEGNWYKTSPQFGQTMLVFENKYGAQTDEDAPKKSITDCISKCAVLLGIGADVHLGLFDDNKYVNDKADKPAPDRAPPKPKPTPPPPAAATDAANQFAKEAVAAITSCTSLEDLSTWKAIKDPRHKTTNVDKVERLKDYNITLYDTVMDALHDAHAKLF